MSEAKNQITISGLLFKIRPVRVSDAKLVISLRNQEQHREKFLNKVSDDIRVQEAWIQSQEVRGNDFYFVVENRLTGQPEGLIGLYDVKDGKAEWGRWIIKDESTAALESFILVCRAAFDFLHLEEIFSRTRADNEKVVRFHDAIGAERFDRQDANPGTSIDEAEVICHRIKKDEFKKGIEFKVLGPAFRQSFKVISSNMSRFDFHHVGVACKSLEADLMVYSMLGYRIESRIFEDLSQGIRGVFLSSPGKPRLELLENLENSSTLDVWNSRGTKLYHLAFFVDSLDQSISLLQKLGFKLTSQPKRSSFFETRIAFLIAPNLLMIELIEFSND